MANKKISQFPIRTSPVASDIIPLVNYGANYAITLSGLTDYIGDIYVTGGTYTAGTATFTNNSGGTFDVTGFNVNVDTDVKHWLEGENKIVNDDKTIVISGNYVLSSSTLTLLSGGTELIISNIKFNKCAQLFIDGYLLLIDSNIINDGIIKVGIATIFVGDSSITGTGIII
jgi:hypothetical protein